MQERDEVNPPPPEVTTTMTSIVGTGVADAVTPYRSDVVAEPTAPENPCQCMTQPLQAYFLHVHAESVVNVHLHA